MHDTSERENCARRSEMSIVRMCSVCEAGNLGEMIEKPYDVCNYRILDGRTLFSYFSLIYRLIFVPT